MSPRRQLAPRDLVAAAALTLSVHLLFGLLVLMEKRAAPREPAAPNPLRVVPIYLPPLPPAPPPETDRSAELPPRTPEGSSAARAERLASVVRPIPPAAITLPATEPAQQDATGTDSPPRIDWHAEARRIAAQSGEPESTEFSGPVKKMREPCKPRKSSFEWKTPVRKEEGVTGVSITSGALTLGWEPPPPNTHFFDDMKEGKTPHSSVPDPNFCD